MKTTTIAIQQPGHTANALIDCLRERAQPYGVGVQQSPGTGPVMVVDQGDRVEELAPFIEEQLDDCAAEASVNWELFLSVPSPPQRPPAAT
jgi:hypothetical protein